MRRIIAVVFCLAVLSVAFACSTMEGLGKDIKKVGQGIENAADRD